MKTHLIESKTHNKKSLVSHFMNVGFVNAQPYIFIHLMKEQPKKRQRVKSIGFYAYDAQHCGVFCEISFMLICWYIQSVTLIPNRFASLRTFYFSFKCFAVPYSSSFGTSTVDLYYSFCYIRMSFIHVVGSLNSTQLNSLNHISLEFDRIAITDSHFRIFFFIWVIHTIPYKINFIYFHSSNQRHKINN